MITKINKIKNFGVFKDFNGSSITEFKPLNLIYGWNYSGKTTLSRVFRSLEQGKIHQDYLSATFEFDAEQNNKYSHTFTITPNIKVFNSDFIKDNLQWDKENIAPIFLLGEENIELQKDLSEKQAALAKSEQELINQKNAKQENESSIEGLLSRKASEVGNLLSLRPFTKVHFRPLVEKAEGKATSLVLDEKNFDKYKNKALSTDQKPIISQLNILINDISILKGETGRILAKQVVSEERITKLLNNNTLSNWVETGKDLHKGKSICEFCGGPLAQDLIEKLNKHFSKDFDFLKSEITSKIQKLNNAIIKLASPLPSITNFYNDFQSDYNLNKPTLETEIEKYNEIIISLVKDLELKKERPFDKLETSSFNDNSVELKAAVEKINLVIKNNNKRSADFDKERASATEKLKEHYAGEFEVKENYSKIIQGIASSQKSIEAKENSISSQKVTILAIQNKLSETVKGAELINSYLIQFFGKDDIKIEATADKKFKLIRGGSDAKNLSEGEKTAISFAYFITKLDEKNNKISDSIIYIDDPISSLDSNHLFNIYSFIKSKFFDAATKTVKCKQLFISTHNFDFYNLIYNWFKVRNIGKNKQSFYLIERSKNAKKDESKLKDSSHLIEKFKSEYVYLFSIIYEFHEGPSDDFDHLYHLPNIIRRFIETYLNFKFLSSINIEESIERLISDPVDCERVRKFIHYYSHSLTTDKFMKFADLAECSAVVQIVLTAVENNDPVHYKSLIDSVKQP